MVKDYEDVLMEVPEPYRSLPRSKWREASRRAPKGSYSAIMPPEPGLVREQPPPARKRSEKR